MARKTAGRRPDRPAPPEVVKVTLTLTAETAQRLAVEAAMRRPRVTMSQVVEEVMGPRLRRWRLPSTIEEPGDPAPGGRAGDAA